MKKKELFLSLAMLGVVITAPTYAVSVKEIISKGKAFLGTAPAVATKIPTKVKTSAKSVNTITNRYQTIKTTIADVKKIDVKKLITPAQLKNVLRQTTILVQNSMEITAALATIFNEFLDILADRNPNVKSVTDLIAIFKPEAGTTLKTGVTKVRDAIGKVTDINNTIERKFIPLVSDKILPALDKVPKTAPVPTPTRGGTVVPAARTVPKVIERGGTKYFV